MLSIIVKTQFEGFHKYENAPDEAAYLRNMHRHMFNVECKIQVFHNDRELEFIMVKHKIDSWLQHHFHDTVSCEQIAEYLKDCIIREYCTKYERKMSIKVFEDNENGVELEVQHNA